MQKKTVFRFAAIALSATVLSGCSGEPSEGDIQAAVEANFNATMAQAKAASGGSKMAEDMLNSMMPKIKEIKKIGCEESGKDSYTCNVEITAKMADAKEPAKAIKPITFVKGSDGWVMSQ